VLRAAHNKEASDQNVFQSLFDESKKRQAERNVTKKIFSPYHRTIACH
jgi:hypothetical protein